jgi:hypothetical protein
MDIYLVESATGLTQLKASTMEEAVKEVKEDFVNTGKKTIVRLTYQLLNRVTNEVDTTYNG